MFLKAWKRTSGVTQVDFCVCAQRRSRARTCKAGLQTTTKWSHFATIFLPVRLIFVLHDAIEEFFFVILLYGYFVASLWRTFWCTFIFKSAYEKHQTANERKLKLNRTTFELRSADRLPQHRSELIYWIYILYIKIRFCTLLLLK